MKVKFFLCALRGIIDTTHLYAAAFGSVTPYCNRPASNLMFYLFLYGKESLQYVPQS